MGACMGVCMGCLHGVAWACMAAHGGAALGRPAAACCDHLGGSYRGREAQDSPSSRGKAASRSSILTPSRACAAGGMSSRCRITFWSGPSMRPAATMGQRA
jgi:hypothetical protein